MHPPVLSPESAAADAQVARTFGVSARLAAYADLDTAARRLDELATCWDASAVLVLWKQPGDGFVDIVGSSAFGARSTAQEIARIASWATRQLVEGAQSAVRWRALYPQDNLLRRESVHGLPAPQPVACESIPLRTPEGGHGGLVLVDAKTRPADATEEAECLALRLPATLQREREHEARLRAVFSGMRGGIVVVGSDDELRFVTGAAQRALDLRTEIWNTSLAHLAEGQLVELIAAARHAHGQVRGEFDGPHGPMAAEVSWLSDRRPSALLVQLHDRAERRKVERLQNEFVGTIGHELKTPLTSARTALELISAGETGPLGDEQEHMVGVVMRNLTRLEHLVHQLLDTARQRVGRLVLQREVRPLASVLESVLEGSHRAAQRSGRCFAARLDPDARAHVDAIRFGEIVENLVGNALKFTPAGGNVRVRVRAEMPCPFPGVAELARALGHATDGVEVEVCDDGPGMDATTREHAFDAFFQDGDPLADRPSGAGLGLAIVRSLVQAHDGHVELHTELERGTCARVWVPGNAALARTLSGVNRLRSTAREFLRRETEVRLELAPLSASAQSDLAGLDHVDGNDLLLVRLGDRHLARLSTRSGRGAPLPGSCCAVLGKDGPRIGTTLAQLAVGLPRTPGPAGGDHDRQEEPRP